MIDPSFALQDAIGTVLAGAAAVTALVPADSILDRTSLPITAANIVIGEGQTVHEEMTFRRDTARVYLDLHVWTLDDNTAGAKAVTGAMRDALRNRTPWSIENWRVVDLVFQTTRFMRDRQGDVPLSHAVMTVNALLQEAAQ